MEWKMKFRYDRVISGVYMLISENRVVYVGQSNDICRRVKYHRQIPWTHYLYYETDDQEEKARMEAAQIKKYNPVYNIVKHEIKIPNQVNTAIHREYSGKHREERWRAEAEIIKKYRNQVGSLSSRQMKRLLWLEYNVNINHNTINNDMKTKKYTPYL